jgi:hypothetical protein
MNIPEQLPMFAGPEFCPLMPPKNSAAEDALMDLLNGPITQKDWLDRGLSWRLSAGIKQLGYLGWEPQSIRVKHPGWHNKIAEYSLLPKAMQAAALMRQRGAK